MLPHKTVQKIKRASVTEAGSQQEAFDSKKDAAVCSSLSLVIFIRLTGFKAINGFCVKLAGAPMWGCGLIFNFYHNLNEQNMNI